MSSFNNNNNNNNNNYNNDTRGWQVEKDKPRETSIKVATSPQLVFYLLKTSSGLLGAGRIPRMES